MALILKKHNLQKKGVILLAHRELLLFRLASISNYLLFNQLVKNYNFVLHIGWYHKKLKPPYWLKYVITSPGNLGAPIGNGVSFENICSRDVLPKTFSLTRKTNRKYDFVYICNNSKNKRAREYFELAKSMPDRHFAFVLSYPECPDPAKFDIGLPEEIKHYQDLLGTKSNLTFFDAKHSSSGYLLSRSDIADVLNDSKIYIHMCRREGESRSLGEALACGCFLALHVDFVGGAKDLCHAENSVRFTDIEDLREKVEQVVLHGIDYSKNAEEYLTIRANTMDRLSGLLQELGLNSDEISNLFSKDLSMVLPGHVQPEFKEEGNSPNADVTNASDFFRFSELCGLNVSSANRELLAFLILLRRVMTRAVRYVKSRKVF
jgi:hypothetical protein